MKEIKAYIKTHKLDAVMLALHKIEGLPGLSIVDVRGCGHRHRDSGRAPQLGELVHHVKLEVVCRDEQVDRITKVIQASARTGLHGDGKIYISNIEQAVRIETGESGEQGV